MSLNNEILIEEVRKDEFRVSSVDVDAESGYIVPGGEIVSLKEAIVLGQRELNEYGLRFIFLEDTEKGELEAMMFKKRIVNGVEFDITTEKGRRAYYKAMQDTERPEGGSDAS